MKTIVIESNKENGTVNSSVVTSTADGKNADAVNSPEKVNGLPLSNEFKDGDKKAEPKKEEAKAPAPEKVKTDKPQTAKAKPQQATPKVEVKAVEPVKQTLNLEGTLKLVEELFRRKKQRDRLLETIETLETFEVAQIDDADETEANHFQGCVLTIEDDNRRKFTTKNPFIIQAVAQYVNSMCVDRLSEIEAGIIIPA